MGTLQDGNTTMMTRKTLILILAAVVALAAARPDVKDLVKDLNELEHDVALITKEIMLEEETDCTRGTRGSDHQTGRCVVEGQWGTAERKWKKWDCTYQGSCRERWRCCVKEDNLYSTHHDYKPLSSERSGKVKKMIDHWEEKGTKKKNGKSHRSSFQDLTPSETGIYGGNRDAYKAHLKRMEKGRRSR